MLEEFIETALGVSTSLLATTNLKSSIPSPTPWERGRGEGVQGSALALNKRHRLPRLSLFWSGAAALRTLSLALSRGEREREGAHYFAIGPVNPGQRRPQGCGAGLDTDTFLQRFPKIKKTSTGREARHSHFDSRIPRRYSTDPTTTGVTVTCLRRTDYPFCLVGMALAACRTPFGIFCPGSGLGYVTCRPFAP